MILAAHERGAGAPVLLLHGLFGQARNLAALQARLARGHRVVALDLRNHGASPHAMGMDYATLAADVTETLDALGIERCAAIGHSMGGKVAMRLALNTPARVSRLLVADIAPRRYDSDFSAFAAAMLALPLADGLTRSQADAALSAAAPDAGVRAFLLQNLIPGAPARWRIGLAEIAAGLDDILDWPAVAKTYDGPALFVGGARSDYLAAPHRAPIRALFPAARTVMLKDAGHWLHADNPDGFGSIAEHFLA